jgi:hypothetical protein
VSDLEGFCTPAVVEGNTAIIDSSTALASYRLRATDGATSPEIKHLFVHALGPIYLDTYQPDRLLEPATVAKSGPVSPPVDSAHALDRYKCHRVKDAAESPRYFPRKVRLNAASLLDTRRYDFKRVSRICNPVSMDGSTIKNPAGHLLCYLTRRSRNEPRHTSRIGVGIASSLLTTSVDTRDVNEICVPAF